MAPEIGGISYRRGFNSSLNDVAMVIENVTFFFVSCFYFPASNFLVQPDAGAEAESIESPHGC